MTYELFKDKWIVVTGGLGFIGSALIRYMNDIGYDNIVIVDRFDEESKWKNLVGKKFVDLVSPEEFFSYFDDHVSDIEAIIHMGALSATDTKDHEMYYHMNYRYSVDLCERALENNILFSYASSAATYGDGSLGFDDDEDTLHHLRPMNMYGMSKHMFDLWAKKQGILGDILGFKFFNVFGPNENHKGNMASMVLHMHRQIQQSGSVKLFASNDPNYPHGGQKRDFIYVKDVVHLVLDSLLEGFKGIFNIGTGHAHTWNELAKAVFQSMKKPENITYIPLPEGLAKQYQNFTEANMQKMESRRKKAGSENFSFTSLNEAIEDYVTQYLQPDSRW